MTLVRSPAARLWLASVLAAAGLFCSCTNPQTDDHPGLPTSGSVIKGQVLDDSTSQPVPYVRVGLYFSSRIRYILTDSRGRFVISGIPPAVYTVRTQRAGFSDLQSDVPAGVNDTSTVTLRLRWKREIPRQKPLGQGIVRINAKTLEEDYNGDGVYRPFVAKGVAFSPTPIGGYTVSRSAVDRSMFYLDSLHANTIRTYSGADPYLLSQAADHGVFVIVSFWVDGALDLSSPSGRDDIIGGFAAMVRTLKDYPSVLLWNLGNEQNYQANSNNPYWYDLVQELALTAYEIEGRSYHPVCASNGDFWNIGDAAKCADDASLSYMDLWGSNIYKINLSNSFSSYRTRTQKPLVITEFGIDALNNQTKTEQEDMQALVDSLNWTQIRAAADFCVGATVFEFTDEWWKAGDPVHHDDGGYASSEHPDGFSNEEWWGLIAVTPDADGDGIDEWRARKAFWMFSRNWQ